MAMDSQQGRDIRSRYAAALAYSDYRKLWIASMSSGAAAWALIVARGWLVYEISDSSLWVGVVTFAAMIPRVLVSPFTGYLADRFDRRLVLASMFGLNLAHNLVLAVLALTGNVEVWHLVVLSLVNGSARAAQMPASQSLIPNIVPKHLILNGIALHEATMHGSRLIGPAAIAPLLATTGPTGAFFLCTGLYAISLVQSLRIRTASTGKIDRSKNFARNFAAGAVYAYQTPMLRAIILIALFHCGLTMSFESLLPVLSSARLNAEGAGFSYLMMAVGTGALLASATLAGIRSELARGRLFLYVGVMSGLAQMVLGFAPNMAMALLGAGLMGMAQAAFMTLTHTMIQVIVPDSVRGRVGGIYSVHIGGMMASANLLNGMLADYIPAPILLIAGGLAFVGIIALSWNYISLRQIYTRGLSRETQAAAAD